MNHFLMILLVSLSALVSPTLASAEIKLIPHPIFGQIPESEADLFEQFKPYQNRIMELAAVLGVKKLPVSYASFGYCPDIFLKEIANNRCLNYQAHLGRYDNNNGYLFFGKNPYLSKKEISQEELYSIIHETAHAILREFLMKRLNLASLSQLSIETIGSGITDSVEFYADMFAELVLLNPKVARKLFGAIRPYSKARVEMREVNYNDKMGKHTCPPTNGNHAHFYYPCARKYIWNEIFIKKLSANRSAIPKLLLHISEITFEMQKEDIEAYKEAHVAIELKTSRRQRVSVYLSRGFYDSIVNKQAYPSYKKYYEHEFLKINTIKPAMLLHRVTLFYLKRPANILDDGPRFIDHSTYDEMFIFRLEKKLGLN